MSNYVNIPQCIDPGGSTLVPEEMLNSNNISVDQTYATQVINETPSNYSNSNIYTGNNSLDLSELDLPAISQQIRPSLTHTTNYSANYNISDASLPMDSQTSNTSSGEIISQTTEHVPKARKRAASLEIESSTLHEVIKSKIKSSKYSNTPVPHTPASAVASKSFPDNLTLRSSGSKTTVVFKQTDNIKSPFSLDPISIAKSLKDLFPNNEIKDVRINRRRNLVAVELKLPIIDNINKLLSIKNLGKWGVQGHQPASDLGTHCSGVIGPISKDVNLNELLEIQESNIKIIHITRLPKFTNSVKQESMVIKLDFEGQELPDKVFFGCISYLVRKYNPPLIRCYRCQRPGHMASGCLSPTRCLICGGNHTKEDCIADTPHCANCGDDHIASFRHCRYNVQAQQIDKLTKSGISFQNAKRQVDRVFNTQQILTKGPVAMNNDSVHPNIINNKPRAYNAAKQSNLTTLETQVDVHTTQGSYFSVQNDLPSVSNIPSYRDALKGNSDHNNHYAHPNTQHRDNTSNLSTTMPLESHFEKLMKSCQDLIESSMRILYVKLAKFLKEAFSLKLQDKQSRERELLLVSVTRHHFGAAAADILLGELECQERVSRIPQAAQILDDISNVSFSTTDSQTDNETVNSKRKIESFPKMQTRGSNNTNSIDTTKDKTTIKVNKKKQGKQRVPSKINPK